MPNSEHGRLVRVANTISPAMVDLKYPVPYQSLARLTYAQPFLLPYRRDSARCGAALPTSYCMGADRHKCRPCSVVSCGSALQTAAQIVWATLSLTARSSHDVTWNGKTSFFGSGYSVGKISTNSNVSQCLGARPRQILLRDCIQQSAASLMDRTAISPCLP